MDTADFDALRGRAAATLPSGAMTFIDCGADDERTVKWNEQGWSELGLVPHALQAIGGVSTHTTILGTRVASPIMIAPSGRHKLFDPEGEAATARAAAAAAAVYVMSTSSNVPMETVAAIPSPAPRWFQLYCGPDRGATLALIQKAEALGFGAIILTVDQPVAGWSPRAARDPIVRANDMYVNIAGSPLAHSAYDKEASGKPRFPVTEAQLAWICSAARLPVVVKGILRRDDATRCVDVGAAGVIVSNHGGRHLDSVIPTSRALPPIVEAVGGTAEVYVDGGIRRGTDVLKALALGARAVLVARPILWALAVGGEALVAETLEHLRTDLERAMALCGTPTIDDLVRDLVAHSGPLR